MTDNQAAGSLPLPSLSVSHITDLGQLGEYRLVEKLGEGGMGVVYKAVHTELDRVVAVKVLPAGRLGDDESMARFHREIKAIGRLDHPHIVRAFDARRIGETHFLVMEFVEGPDWEHLVRRRGPLRVADVCELGRQAALGLQHAHEHGLIHRDIKPSNLMLTREGQVKILDLGLARIQGGAVSQALTISGQIMGTPDYIAPEQSCDSHNVDIRADLYSLGCTLYKLLAGALRSRTPLTPPCPPNCGLTSGNRRRRSRNSAASCRAAWSRFSIACWPRNRHGGSRRPANWLPPWPPWRSAATCQRWRRPGRHKP